MQNKILQNKIIQKQSFITHISDKVVMNSVLNPTLALIPSFVAVFNFILLVSYL